MDVSVKQSLTRDDFIRTGACFDGVREGQEKYFPNATVVSVRAALRSVDDDDACHILRAANLDGYGYGYGDGNG